MAWRIDIDDKAKKELAGLNRAQAKHITTFLHERVAKLDDPRSIGEALKGSKFGDFWKYRVGDYQIVASIEDTALLFLVVRIGNLKDVYLK